MLSRHLICCNSKLLLIWCWLVFNIFIYLILSELVQFYFTKKLLISRKCWWEKKIVSWNDLVEKWMVDAFFAPNAFLVEYEYLAWLSVLPHKVFVDVVVSTSGGYWGKKCRASYLTFSLPEHKEWAVDGVRSNLV